MLDSWGLNEEDKGAHTSRVYVVNPHYKKFEKSAVSAQPHTNTRAHTHARTHAGTHTHENTATEN